MAQPDSNEVHRNKLNRNFSIAFPQSKQKPASKSGKKK